MYIYNYTIMYIPARVIFLKNPTQTRLVSASENIAALSKV